jgi:hypothetical protein
MSNTIKANEKKSLSESLTNVLGSIATFDEDYIKGSTSFYANDPAVQ